MQPRQIARELALLSLSQFSKRKTPENLESMILAAVKTLQTEASESLEMASAQLERGNDRLLNSETVAPNIASSRAMLKEAVELTQMAINQLGDAMTFPEKVHYYQEQTVVQDYALELVSRVVQNHQELDSILSKAMVNWQLERIARIDRDILRIAVAEILYVNLDERIAIDEAVKLAKRYSGDQEYRFINGVLRRVVTLLKEEQSK
ncbi:transcription antitermination factor NusB [Roseofilum reptotaenium CS-1145]|uniref:Transcription antitermination protein NusB n=1 Tax=Roseofilum reptotaenium AO1-A TaxID=1925591 RepID=A0A1L9QNQ8_9CYAN|nr:MULTISPECIES: transcription antitermination factor NusB [Roseofilum]MBP0029394.1 transcription antitermination protein NusB [Roseofilum sp. Guam]MDB9518691.1 transcription antitermination factor NusB [Roseofilum reptotaenium CS-1145]OJJ24227.1 transcription antitermination factor NusB [Roseofilum reptotaenium AO1-A]